MVSSWHILAACSISLDVGVGKKRELRGKRGEVDIKHHDYFVNISCVLSRFVIYKLWQQCKYPSAYADAVENANRLVHESSLCPSEINMYRPDTLP